MHRTARRRVTRLAIISLVVLVIGYGAFSYTIVHSVLLHEVDETSERLATPLTRILTRPRVDRHNLEQAIREYPLWLGDHVSVRDPAGRILGARGNMALVPDPLPMGAHEIGGSNPYRLIVTPVVVNGERRGTIVQLRHLDDFWHTLEHIILGLVSLLPLSVLLAIALSMWLAEIAARPIEDALDRERHFARDASHELRTPLALLLTQAQLLLQRPDLAADVREKLEVIEGRARRIKAILQDLLTLGRGDGGLGEAPLRFSLCELLEEEVAGAAPLAAERGVRVALAPPPSEVEVLGSPHGLAQALHNLLENAILYSPPGGTVSVRLEVRNKHARVLVSNPGPGIPPEDRTRVFERFVRLGHGRDANPEGNGLGLAIARAIARAHKGDLTLATRSAEGTTFKLSVPLA